MEWTKRRAHIKENSRSTRNNSLESRYWTRPDRTGLVLNQAYLAVVSLQFSAASIGFQWATLGWQQAFKHYLQPANQHYPALSLSHISHISPSSPLHSAATTSPSRAIPCTRVSGPARGGCVPAMLAPSEPSNDCLSVDGLATSYYPPAICWRLLFEPAPCNASIYRLRGSQWSPVGHLARLHLFALPRRSC